MELHSSKNDAELIEGLKKGDEQCYSILFKKYWRELYRIAVAKIQSHELAEEFVQDIFLKLWEKRATLAIDDLGNYLKASLSYKCIDHIRRNMVHDKYSKYYRILLQGMDKGPEANVERSELKEALRSGIASLPHKTRKMLILNRFYGFSVREIANRFEVSEKAVEYHLTKSLKSLRGFLRDYVLFILSFLHLY